ncbi:hypothetical protein [Sinorhizobium fredii]|uniref:hypothetical protein n=1 Tax=Rhizobium fredii TaxID=380 RepID=UPI00339845ED
MAAAANAADEVELDQQAVALGLDSVSTARGDNGERNVTGATKIDAQTARRVHDGGVKLLDVRSKLSLGGPTCQALSPEVITSMTKAAFAKIADEREGVIFSCHGKYCGDSAFASTKSLAWGYKKVTISRAVSLPGTMRTTLSRVA